MGRLLPACPPTTRSGLASPTSDTVTAVPFTPPPMFRTPNELPDVESVNLTVGAGAPPFVPRNGPVAAVPRWTSRYWAVGAPIETAPGDPPTAPIKPRLRP